MNTGEERAGGGFAFGLAALPFLCSIGGLLLCIYALELPLYLALLLGWGVAVAIAVSHRFSWRDVWRGTYQGMKSTLLVIGILLLIAGVISSWLISGTVPGLIYYGMQFIQPEYLVVMAFLLTAGTSIVLGSSVGTLSTMGAAIAGLGLVFGISPGLIGGALISGAMVGDRMSPVSGAFHLLSSMTGTKPEHNYKPLLSTGLPMLLICTGLFFWLGHGAGAGAPADPQNTPLVSALTGQYDLPWFVLLPPAMVLLLAALRVPIHWNLSLGIVTGAVLAIWVQGESVAAVLRAVWFGFELREGGNSLLHGGGVWPMLNQALLIFCAGMLNGVMEATGMMQTLLQKLLGGIERYLGLIVSSMLLSVSMALLACNQALAIIVPGRALRPVYDRLQVPPRELVRALGDSGVVASALIPWNLHGILCSAAMGIATMTFFPYAFYLLGLPLLTLLLSIWKNRLNSNRITTILN
ncbi:NhaC family Na+:H+ antiporter [Tumebacillus sp. BK434]|uniref:Na+/H+ antiporter NhaC family protein n=1 Tax=Tumebacillus sp. BK434 TaxID=2512169 RepID=UPI0010518642|nr:Na+/H+ antiporter NhaC family protein [Tumebacillus sp. BK434]TCP54697.1 NhaC family Na+:H+ antiporter [Tumebacillus sp. BK434]